VPQLVTGTQCAPAIFTVAVPVFAAGVFVCVAVGVDLPLDVPPAGALLPVGVLPREGVLPPAGVPLRDGVLPPDGVLPGVRPAAGTAPPAGVVPFGGAVPPATVEDASALPARVRPRARARTLSRASAAAVAESLDRLLAPGLSIASGPDGVPDLSGYAVRNRAAGRKLRPADRQPAAGRRLAGRSAARRRPAKAHRRGRRC
jgi:hypothetical protein